MHAHDSSVVLPDPARGQPTLVTVGRGGRFPPLRLDGATSQWGKCEDAHFVPDAPLHRRSGLPCRPATDHDPAYTHQARIQCQRYQHGASDRNGVRSGLRDCGTTDCLLVRSRLTPNDYRFINWHSEPDDHIVWSWTQSFAELAIARMGVAFGEARL